MTREYRAELQAVYPDQAERIGNAAVTFAAGDLLFFHYPLFELVVRASLAAAAHTNVGVKKLQIGETPVVHIPLIQLPAGEISGTHRLPGKIVIASFGYATRAKRITTILETIAELYPANPEIRYVVVGAVEDPPGLKTQITKLGIEECVIVTGHVEMTEFLSWMSRADIVVNLRYPSAGEMSATLVQALASGKPTIISRLTNLRDIPDQAAMRVRPDREKEDLSDALFLLLKDNILRNRLSSAAREFIRVHHSTDRVLDGYRRLIEVALKRKRSFVSPELPLHLQSATQIARHQMLNTSFEGIDSKILDWL